MKLGTRVYDSRDPLRQGWVRSITRYHAVVVLDRTWKYKTARIPLPRVRQGRPETRENLQPMARAGG